MEKKQLLVETGLRYGLLGPDKANMTPWKCPQQIVENLIALPGPQRHSKQTRQPKHAPKTAQTEPLWSVLPSQGSLKG